MNGETFNLQIRNFFKRARSQCEIETAGNYRG